MADPKEVAYAFIKQYYGLFDAGKDGIAQLAALYRNESMLSFEDVNILGAQNIVQHLINLNFTKVEHVVKSFDAQPSGVPNSILVFVQGDMKIEGNEHPVKFSQVWHLIADAGSFWVHNDMFRLNYG